MSSSNKGSLMTALHFTETQNFIRKLMRMYPRYSRSSIYRYAKKKVSSE